jgi:hypothetical protein
MIYILLFCLITLALWLVYRLHPPQKQPLTQEGGKSKRNSKRGVVASDDKNDSRPNLIKGLTFSSNNDKINLNDNYSSKFAGLDSKKSWASNPQTRYLSYLQVDLPGFYEINGVVSKGRDNSKEWVTRYYLEYWDRYSDNWVKYQQVISGNKNDSESVTTAVNFSTNKVRVYPVKWHKHPSLRIGFIGTKVGFSKCRYYRMKMASDNPIDSKHYQQLYQKKCLKVPKETFDLVVNNLRKNKKKMCLTKNKIAFLKKKKEELERLKKECCLVAGELKKLKKSSCPKNQLIDLANRYRKVVDTKRMFLDKKQ